MIRLFPLLVALFCAVAASSASAQVLVYKIDFRKDKGINYHPFSGGYFVAPLLGGTGSFLLTSTDDERVYVESAEGGRLFTALSGGGKKAVISATTGAGTSMGAMVALGDINHVVQVNGPTFSLSARVAKSLTGTAVSADDESESEGPASDGSVGSAGVSEIKVNLDEEETNRANRKGFTLAQTLEQLKLELERQGFHNEDGDDDDDDDDDTDEETVVVEP